MYLLLIPSQILALYAQRPIVENHDRYALYHPSAGAVASMLCDLPYIILNILAFNLTLYFMTNLHREPGRFFFFLLISFFMIFRTIFSTSHSLSEAMMPATVIILALFIVTSFIIPIDCINYIMVRLDQIY